jgi:hypothetical protein
VIPSWLPVNNDPVPEPKSGLPPEPETTGVRGAQGPNGPSFELVPHVSYSSISDTLGQFTDKGITKTAIVFVHTVVRQLENRVQQLEAMLESVRTELKIVKGDAEDKAVLIARHEERAKLSVPTNIGHALMISLGALFVGAYLSAIGQPTAPTPGALSVWQAMGVAGILLFIVGWALALFASRSKP